MSRHPTLVRGRALRAVAVLATFGAAPLGAQPDPYVPPPGEWAHRSPAALGLDSARLALAVQWAQSHEIDWLPDMAAQLARNTAREPYPAIQGPFKDRGRPNGLVVHRGYIVAEWGDTRRVDMTFSVAKSYLSSVAGLAWDRGLIPDLDAPVRELIRDGMFDSPHNAPITWHHLLTQTSEWEGTLWGKPDIADRRNGYQRALMPPGTVWEYNDVRVNRLALALLQRFGEPLPAVLDRELMRPIGASDAWQWHGYRDSYVEIGGRRMQSVSGGGHWGGGVWASTLDHARFGLLHLRRGVWGQRRILSEAWLERAWCPVPLKPTYGYLWWLNTDRKQYAGAPATSVFALGAGGNVIWIDPALDLVVVARWLDGRATSEFMRLVTAAFPAAARPASRGSATAPAPGAWRCPAT